MKSLRDGARGRAARAAAASPNSRLRIRPANQVCRDARQRGGFDDYRTGTARALAAYHGCLHGAVAPLGTVLRRTASECTGEGGERSYGP